MLERGVGGGGDKGEGGYEIWGRGEGIKGKKWGCITKDGILTGQIFQTFKRPDIINKIYSW